MSSQDSQSLAEMQQPPPVTTFIDELEEFQRIEEGINTNQSQSVSEVEAVKEEKKEDPEPVDSPSKNPGLGSIAVGGADDKVRGLNKKRNNKMDLTKGLIDSLKHGSKK